MAPGGGPETHGWDGPAPVAPVALVVEPDDDLREEVAAELRARGLVVDEAQDGLGALLALSHRSPDVVILEVELPHVSGYRVLRVLRQDAASRYTPVVMLAAAPLQEACPSPSEGPLPDCFLQKPVTADAVVLEVLRAAAGVDLRSLRHG